MGMSEKINLQLILHMLIGGFICFALLFLLKYLGLVWALTEWILKSFNSVGVLIFEKAQTGYYIITLGLAYLPSGFLGGLYFGRKIEEKMEIYLAFPSVIGFIISLLLEYYLGLRPDYLRGLIIPFLTLAAGSYLGGYTISWRIEEKPEEERISLVLEE